MNKLLLKSLLLLAGLCASISLNAQEQRHNSKLLSNNNACDVVDIGLGDDLPWESNSLRSFQIGWNKANGEDLIYKGEGIYVFRLAACITNAEFRSRFQNKKELVYDFWDSLEKDMNKIYERDCGIRFEVIKNDKLIFADKEHEELKELGHSSYHTKGTKIITEAIGVENYEVGILIKPITANDPNAGVAVLSGVLSDSNKASARATSDTRIIAHEIGHMFGSLHTHVINPKGASIYTEGGSGQSIMSYGSPVDFFSLPSIQMIRKTLKSLPYYTNKDRTNKISQNKKELSSAPYIDKSNIDRPELLRNEINKEYKVTPGTYYQFYIPVKEKKDSYLYSAHSFDPTNSSQTPHNIQRCYGPSKSNFIMFHPRYKVKPTYTTTIENAPILSESDNFPKEGLYTYILSAFHNGQHDAQTVKLRIVPGNKFEIKKVITELGKWWDDPIPGNPLKLEWEPCIDVYGKDSKVRILMSDDFGQSFKYVLADNVPNTGSWDGYVPYINASLINMLEVSRVRSGVYKIEVIGEAAYALSSIETYQINGKNYKGKGGFILDINNSKAIKFNPMPKVYMEVASESQVPQATALTASYGSRRETIQVNEKREGNLIYRSWTANIGGKKSVYTQLIKVLSLSNNDSFVLKSRIKSIQEMAKELYNNIGTIAYPYGQLEKSKTFISAYEKVFTGDNIKSSVTQSDYDGLISSLEAINNIEDWELVKPITGHSYKIASYSYIFGDKIYHYFKSVGRWEETDKKNEREASAWKLKEQDGIYKFSYNESNLYLESIVNYDGGIMLQKGDTWGSFIPFARNSEGAFYYIRAYKENGQLDSKRYFTSLSELNDYRTNTTAISVTTDFVFKPVANSYKVYLEKGNWTNAKAILKQNGKTKEITANKEQNGRFEFEIPADYFLASIEFVNVDDNSKTPLNYLGGVSAVYNQAAKRVYDLTINNAYSTLYLDYPVSIPEGINAYIATAKPKGSGTIKEYSLELYKLNGTIPAKTAVILHTDNSSTKTIRFEEADLIAPKENNSLVGSLEDVETTDQNDSFLYFDISTPSSSNDAYIFTPINKSKIIDKNKAYLRLYAYNRGESIEKVVLPYNQFEKAPTPVPVPKPEMATITIPSTDGGSISLADGVNASSVEVGKKVSLNILPNAGYKLISIKVNGKDITNSKEFIVQSGNNNIEVVWQEVARIILATAEGGTISLPNNINPDEVAVGTKVSINVKAKEGYKLVSIKANNIDITDTKEFIVQSGNNNIEVVWQEVARIILPTSEGGTISLPNNINANEVAVGTKVSINVSIKEGYKLISIKVNGNDITNSKEFTVQSGNNNIEVVWQEVARIILATSEGGTISLPDNINPDEVAVGTKVSINVKAKEGYKLVSIKANNIDITNSKEFTVQSGENRIEVVWQEVARIILATSEGGTISLPDNINPDEVAVGTKVSINVKAKEGYKLVSIKANNTDITNSKEFTAQSGENRIEVVWQEVARIILPTAEGGTISLPDNINPDEVAVGTKVSINVKAKEGYKLVSIKANNTDITNLKEFTVQSGDNRIEVVWQKTTSIDITKEIDTLKIYPNPTKDFVILSKANIGTKYKIYTINGVLIKEGEVQSDKHYISLSELSSGIYIIIIDNKSIKIEKL